VDAELERLRKKVENYPSPSAYTRLAELLREAGALDDAQRICNRCAKEFPRNGRAFVILAGIHKDRGDQNAGVSELERAINGDPRSIEARCMLADCYAEAGRGGEAAAQLQQAQALRPDDPEIKQRLAHLNAGGGAAEPQPAAGQPAGGASPFAANTGKTVDLSGAGALTTMAQQSAAAAAGPDTALAALCELHGVNGACVVDQHGRTVLSRGLESGQDDLLAALAADLNSAAEQTVATIGSTTPLQTWILNAQDGQALGFRRSGLSLVALADNEVKAAMLELRARQVLLDLGAE